MTERLRPETALRILRALASPLPLFYLLPWLMILLVGGTLAQRYVGLFAAQALFLSSFVFWLGPVPLPGAYSVFAYLAISITAKLMVKSPWRRDQAGVLLAHLGVLILLTGGFVTAWQREEGYMVLGEGETGATVSDYHARELAVLRDGRTIRALPFSALHAGGRVQGLPFDLMVESLCGHCALMAQARKDAAPLLTLSSLPPRREEEENQAGAVLRVEEPGKEPQQIIAFEALAQPAEFPAAGERYAVVMRRAQRPLPFSLTLKKFARTVHPGTEIPSSYRSLVTVSDGPFKSDAAIEMNAPLHHAGYTVYQSSYVGDEGHEKTVLAVVRNAGAIFPYLALALLCAGLGWHAIATFVGKQGSNRATSL